MQLVKDHYYKGDERSYTYNYFYAPICSIWVKFLPLWLSANLVTFFGFLANLIPHVLVIWCFGWDMDGPVAPWFSVLVGVSFLFYNFMDNLDGK